MKVFRLARVPRGSGRDDERATSWLQSRPRIGRLRFIHGAVDPARRESPGYWRGPAIERSRRRREPGPAALKGRPEEVMI